ncbi:S-locus receptor kinase [Trema orientale]|uniref:S-locus receptor kinase n=1 Tax=Trema orientale TaxID=63057 RepID=A0A2P5E9K7_TREOI|nr:S-locus receptor kinase [Trema orientale]
MAVLTFTDITIIFIVMLFNTVSFAVLLDSINGFGSLNDGNTVVSRGGSFELGFFSPGSSKNRYLGIWYKSIPVQTVVWVANRCNPINDSSGVLKINDTGNLVLWGQNKSVVWYTSSLRRVRRPIAQLLDTGNLVVRDEDDQNPDANLWKSFDYPCDTLLPEMKVGWDLRTGLKRRLSAWKSTEDPCPGDFTYGIEFSPNRHTFPEAYIRKGTAKFYRSGPWNGLRLSGSPELRPNPLYDFNFVFNDDEVYYIYSLRNKSVISRIVMNQTTSIRERLTWIEAEQTWKRYSSVPRDDCDNYGVCGANGNCIIGDNPMCYCLKGFKPKSQEKWSLMDWSEGCVRNVPLNCHDKNKDGFLKFSGFKLPDTTNSWLDKRMNLKECRAKCLSSCSCMAYTNSDIRGEGSGCAIWFGDLIDIRQFASGGQEIYIRMPHSELAKADRKVRAILIVVAVIGGVAGMILFGYCICRRRNFKDVTDENETIDRNETINENQGQEEDLDLPLFNLSTVSIATDNFSVSKKLGEGGFGPVYRGKLEDGQEIAVKRLSMSSGQGVNEFKNEAWTLMSEDRPFELLDKSLTSSCKSLHDALRCIHIGLLCVQQSPVDRPNMSSVVLMLGSQIELPHPKPPGYFMEMESMKGDYSSTKPESSSTNDMSITLLEPR